MSEEIKETEKKDSIKELIEKAAPYIQKIVAKWKKLIIINGVIAVLSAAILLLFVKNFYDASVVILPDYGASSGLGGLSGLASLAGISVGQSTPTEIYNNLLFSESVLRPVIMSKYKTSEYDTLVNLIEYYELEPKKTSNEDPVWMQERDKFLQMMKIMREKIIVTDLDRVTTILTMTIRTNERALSAKIANSIATSLDDYVRNKRKSNAKEQRVYIEERVFQVKDSLTIIENRLKDFREQNRIVAQSPQLLLEQGRLQRTLTIQQEIYIELTKQLEIVKLEEIKDVPILNIREEVGLPIEKAGPSRLRILIIIMFLSGSISCLFVVYKNKLNEVIDVAKNVLLK